MGVGSSTSILSFDCCSSWNSFSPWRVHRTWRCASKSRASRTKTYLCDTPRGRDTPAPLRSAATCGERNRLRIQCHDSSRKSYEHERTVRDRRRGATGSNKPIRELCTYMNLGSNQVERTANRKHERQSGEPFHDPRRILKRRRPARRVETKSGKLEKLREEARILVQSTRNQYTYVADGIRRMDIRLGIGVPRGFDLSNHIVQNLFSPLSRSLLA